MSKEKKFYDTLQNVFIGAKLEGEGGFINLMKMKSSYYKGIESVLKKDIGDVIKKYPNFKDELYDKLYTFFSRYFTESGSIYFNSTPFHNKIYEQVYTDDRDVILFWKTQMLYYVKTDRIFQPAMEVIVDELKFKFDASKVENKKANEKRNLIYELGEVKRDKTISLIVRYSEKGKVTKTEDILKEIKKKDIKIAEEQLEKAFSVFQRQSEVDFFINKDAKKFLQEQFKLWSYQYFWDGAKEWTADRVNEIAALKDIAYKIIDFVSQFEDELVKIWNKPKFVKNSNYVITLDRILSACEPPSIPPLKKGGRSEATGGFEKEIDLIKRIFAHKGMKEQFSEWESLGITPLPTFFKGGIIKSSEIMDSTLQGEKLKKEFEHLPIDTKYFKDLELEILSLFDHLDEALDGRLIKSENYQALNTIINKYKGEVQTIYIDPPFNLDSSDQFLYRTNYKNANWATLLENRLRLSRDFLKDTGSIFVRCDYNGNWIVRCLLDQQFGESNFRNEIIVKKSGIQKEAKNKFLVATESIFYYSNNNSSSQKDVYEARETDWLPFVHYPRENNTNNERNLFGKVFLPPKGRHWGINQNLIEESLKTKMVRLKCSNCNYLHYEGMLKNCPKCKSNQFIPEIKNPPKKVDSNWSNIQSYSQDPDFPTRNSETLLKRVINVSSNYSGIVLDFFLGSGTLTATAHKLSKKWIGIDQGEYFFPYVGKDGKPKGILSRMKEVLSGKSNLEPYGITKEVNYKGGGFFKYYELEQYEEALSKCKYSDGDLFSVEGRSDYEQYVFMKDEKLLDSIELDYKKNKVNVKLENIYENIDIAETLSNLSGKWIKRIEEDKVIFEDDSEVNTKELDYRLIKPLIWWE